MTDIGVYLSMFKAFLQILIYSFVRNLAQKREIRYTDLLLLGDFECGFLDLRLAAGFFGLPGAEKRRLPRA